MKKQIIYLAEKYHLQLIYVFGSRSKETLDLIEGRIPNLASTQSDLDIGIKSQKHLNIEEKVEIAIFFEDLFKVPRVDVVVIPEVSIFLALEIVTGEILYKINADFEAEYQLYIMRQAADMMPYQKMKNKMLLGIDYGS
ncbi:MAG: hypothetical protein A2161_17410 [Candidatus Schekmanbacteria bacterium RBG_13_48_7]|uniref:Polymerase beta nucleotidyltransferase domain-containing protein n=1 Tax=Candidatus Schekmanbacteria bacterium RBG_13_48_7 TaxID=1817878 RepID=A0A1F7S5Y2_9BACT|nr:MAG: hypothetical protein A2161_17410 [Candidatus Schekmanbacteria bacterium RBG_13_48_7]